MIAQLWLNAAVLFDPENCLRVTLTLMHFLWQGTVIAVAVLTANWGLRNSTAGIRYAVSIWALLAMVACLPVTFAMIRVPGLSAKQIINDVAAHRSAKLLDVKRDDGREHAVTIPVNAIRETVTEVVHPPVPSRNPQGTGSVSAGRKDSLMSALNGYAPYATSAYLVGVAVMLFRLLVSLWSGRRLINRVKTTEDLDLISIVRRRASGLRMKVVPTVAYCERTAIPVVIGIVKPMILLPTSLAFGMQPADLDAIITHELVHIQRWDLFINLFQRLVESLLFFHPAVWFVSHCVSMERETACDDVVVSIGHRPIHYAGALIRMAELCGNRRSKSAAAYLATLSTTGDNPSQFMRRVMRLLDCEPPVRLTRKGAMGAAALFSALFILPIVLLRTLSPVIADEPHTAKAAVDNTTNAAAENNATKKPKMVAPTRLPVQVAHKLARFLSKREFDQAVELFDPELSQIMPAEKLKSLWQELETKYDKVLFVKYLSEEPFGESHLWSFLIVGPEELELRADIDDNDRVSGIWFSEKAREWDLQDFHIPVDEGSIFGSRIKEIAARNQTLHVKIIDLNGERPQKIQVYYYREVEPSEVARERDWIDAVTKKTWRYFTDATVGGGDSWTTHYLKPAWYRAVAHSFSSSGTPFGMSTPIWIDESDPHGSVEIQVQRGGNVHLSIARDDAKALSNSNVTITRRDTIWPQLQFSSQTEGNEFTYRNIPPGKYTITATAWSEQYNERRYETKDVTELDVVAGETQDVRLTLVGRPPTDAELNAVSPWVATGRVTDPDGRPVAGAEIWAWAGVATVFPSVIAKTDNEGRYYGRFASNGHFMDREEDPFHVVSASVSARKDGLFEANLSRHGHMNAAERLPRPDEVELVQPFDPNRFFVPGKPQEINFILKPAVEIVVQVLDRDGKPVDSRELNLDGNELPPGSSVLDSEKSDAAGHFTFRNVPTGFEWWFGLNLDERPYIRSTSIKLPTSRTRYEVVLQHSIEEQTGFDRLVFLSVRDATGNDVKNSLVVDDRYQLPPVPPATQEQGREILRTLRTANRYWLIGPPADVKKYSYEFKLHENSPVSITLADPATHSISEHRGISYDSAIDCLTTNPEKVIFRRVDVGDERIELVYALRDAARYSAGNGISKSWIGHFSFPIKKGTLIIDAKTVTPIEHRSGGLTEQFSDYVEIDRGHYAPRRIQINWAYSNHEEMNFDWRFKVHKPGLWLFDQSTYEVHGGKYNIEVTNVVVE